MSPNCCGSLGCFLPSLTSELAPPPPCSSWATSLLLISFFGLRFYSFLIFCILSALAGNQLGQSDCAQRWLMAWSRAKLPDALAFTCGWSLTTVTPSFCDSPGSSLPAGSALRTWLACLVVANGRFYRAAQSPSGCLNGSETFSVPEPACCMIFCAVSFWTLSRDGQGLPSLETQGGLGESFGC